MRSLICCVGAVAVLTATAGSALALDTYVQYVGDNGTWTQDSNWQELVYDPNGYYVLDPSSTGVPANWVDPETGKDILDPNSWHDESAYLGSGGTVTISSSVPTIAKLVVGPHADTVRDFSQGSPSDPSYGVMVPTGLPSKLVIADGADIYLNRVDETNPGDGSVDVVFRQQSAYGAEIVQTGGKISTVFTHICEDAATNVGDGLRPYQGTVLYTMSGGTLESRFKMYVGRSLAASTGGSEAWGYFDMSDGVVNVGNTAHGGELSIGAGGRGTLSMTGGLISTVAGATPAGVTVGSGSDPNYVSRGSVNQGGGTVYASKYLVVGKDSGAGSYTISDGLLRIGSASAQQVDNDIGIGGSVGEASGSLVINGGRVELTGSKALRIGNSNSAGLDARGTLLMTAGAFIGTTSAADSLLVGYNKANADTNVGYGLVDVSGGSFHVAGRMSLGVRKGNAELSVGRNATFIVGALTTNNSSLAGGTVAIGVELGGLNYNSKIQVQGGTVDLRGSSYRAMHVATATGYRPKQGDIFEVIAGSTADIQGSLNAITTDITIGQARSDPNDPNSALVPFFTGMSSYNLNTSSYSYLLTFLGMTSGDANGDHAVGTGDLALMATSWLQGSSQPLYGDANGDHTVGTGDLALMATNWLQAGKTWGQGDFNGDGLVGTGDLALMATNWLVTRIPKTWRNGDFNGDGVISTGDLALMATNWLWVLPGAAPEQPVPEPVSLAVLALGGLAVVCRRPR